MTDPAPLKPKWQLILALVPSFNNILQGLSAAVIALLTTLATQHYTQPPKPMRIPAADATATPAPVVSIDVDPIVKAIEKGFADWNNRRLAAKGNFKSVKGAAK